MAVFGPTTNHAEIRSWAAVNGAVPMEIATTVFDGQPTKIGFRFTKTKTVEPEFKPISWEGFFALFDVLELAFVYDDDRPGSYELLQSDSASQSGFAVGSS